MYKDREHCHGDKSFQKYCSSFLGIYPHATTVTKTHTECVEETIIKTHTRMVAGILTTTLSETLTDTEITTTAFRGTVFSTLQLSLMI